jgi:hypothetical protein
VLLAYGALSTLFNTITFLFAPGENNGLGGGPPSFSDRAITMVGSLLSVDVIVALVGAVMLAHAPAQVKNAKVISLVSLVSLGVADLFGLVALFSAFGANAATGWGKNSTFFISLGELAIAGLGSYLVLAYFQQHGPATPAGGFGQQPGANQWGQAPQPQQQQPWQQPQPGAPQQQPWGPPPQQQMQQPPQQAAPPQPQWGQPQPQQDRDSMMTQAIPTVPPAQQQPPQQGEGGLPIGNWTSE